MIPWQASGVTQKKLIFKNATFQNTLGILEIRYLLKHGLFMTAVTSLDTTKKLPGDESWRRKPTVRISQQNSDFQEHRVIFLCVSERF